MLGTGVCTRAGVSHTNSLTLLPPAENETLFFAWEFCFWLISLKSRGGFLLCLCHIPKQLPYNRGFAGWFCFILKHPCDFYTCITTHLSLLTQKSYFKLPGKHVTRPLPSDPSRRMDCSPMQHRVHPVVSQSCLHSAAHPKWEKHNSCPQSNFL